MPLSQKILLLPGDYIGPEVVDQVRRVISWLSDVRPISLEIDEDYIGGAAVEVYGTPLAAETIRKAKDADAVLLGAVGGPKFDNLSRDMRPEAGLLNLRKELDLFANLRPATTFGKLFIRGFFTQSRGNKGARYPDSARTYVRHLLWPAAWHK